MTPCHRVFPSFPRGYIRSSSPATEQSTRKQPHKIARLICARTPLLILLISSPDPSRPTCISNRASFLVFSRPFCVTLALSFRPTAPQGRFPGSHLISKQPYRRRRQDDTSQHVARYQAAQESCANHPSRRSGGRKGYTVRETAGSVPAVGFYQLRGLAARKRAPQDTAG